MTVTIWLLAAFAASLGAPFWFQGVGRLLALRATGVRPQEEAAAGVSPKLPIGAGAAQTGCALVEATEGPPSSGTSMARNGYEDEVLTRDDFLRIQELLGLPPEKRSGWPDDTTREWIDHPRRSAKRRQLDQADFLRVVVQAVGLGVDGQRPGGFELAGQRVQVVRGPDPEGKRHGRLGYTTPSATALRRRSAACRSRDRSR